ncbi:hypothetical protein QJS10_CPA09g01374 [Acorus calamus]|uniref:Transmembrane protein n=1 Tax=Acorus calamus TaxID=4465 RepID=A0AAV9E2L7_ACOCL|nr:hypothetical protein QJS10_CPA09g01374 [Acorus calamus]
MKPKKKPTSLFLLCFCPAVLDSGDGDPPKCKPILRRKLSRSKKTEHDRSSDDGSTYSKRTDDSMTSSPSSSFRKGSPTPPTPPPPPKQVKMPKQGRVNYGSATVFCLLVASLSVMLFYGRKLKRNLKKHIFEVIDIITANIAIISLASSQYSIKLQANGTFVIFNLTRGFLHAPKLKEIMSQYTGRRNSEDEEREFVGDVKIKPHFFDLSKGNPKKES